MSFKVPIPHSGTAQGPLLSCSLSLSRPRTVSQVLEKMHTPLERANECRSMLCEWRAGEEYLRKDGGEEAAASRGAVTQESQQGLLPQEQGTTAG